MGSGGLKGVQLSVSQVSVIYKLYSKVILYSMYRIQRAQKEAKDMEAEEANYRSEVLTKCNEMSALHAKVQKAYKVTLAML